MSPGKVAAVAEVWAPPGLRGKKGARPSSRSRAAEPRGVAAMAAMRPVHPSRYRCVRDRTQTTEFKPDEIDGCMEALHLCEAVDLVQVVKDGGWRGVRPDPPRGGVKKGLVAAFPVARGTVLGLGPREALLWVHGDVAGVADRGSYFQGKRSNPRPVRLVRHAGHGPWDDTAAAVLALSKMDWNNDALNDPLPVTMAHAKVLARVIKRMTGLGSAPYQLRFFI